VPRSISDSAVFFETDVLGTQTLAALAVARGKRLDRFVHVSSSEVYGTAVRDPMDEEHPLQPYTPYAAAKCAADRLIYAFVQTYALPAVVVRPFNNYGPGQHLEKLLPRFITSALRGDPLTVQVAVQLPYRPYMPAVSPDGKYVAVTNWGDATVSVLDAKTLAVAKNVRVGSHPNALTFAPNVIRQTIVVTLLGSDGIYSNVNKQFRVHLKNAANAVITGSDITVNLLESDPSPRLQFNASLYNVNESEGTAILNVTRINDALVNVTVNYTTIDGTAKQGVNYKATTGMLTFQKGEMSRQIKVPIIPTGNNVSFNVSLSIPGNGSTIGTPDRARVNINNSSSQITYHLVKGWNLISVPLNVSNMSVSGFFSPEVLSRMEVIWG
jgi:YVTN family beta-propeller protein